MWRIIVQVCAFYMQKSESIHFLPFFLVALYMYEDLSVWLIDNSIEFALGYSRNTNYRVRVQLQL